MVDSQNNQANELHIYWWNCSPHHSEVVFYHNHIMIAIEKILTTMYIIKNHQIGLLQTWIKFISGTDK